KREGRSTDQGCSVVWSPGSGAWWGKKEEAGSAGLLKLFALAKAAGFLAATPVVKSSYAGQTHRKQHQGTGFRNERADRGSGAGNRAGVVRQKVEILQLLGRSRVCEHARSKRVVGDKAEGAHVEGRARSSHVRAGPVGRDVDNRVAVRGDRILGGGCEAC